MFRLDAEDSVTGKFRLTATIDDDEDEGVFLFSVSGGCKLASSSTTGMNGFLNLTTIFLVGFPNKVL